MRERKKKLERVKIKKSSDSEGCSTMAQYT